MKHDETIQIRTAKDFYEGESIQFLETTWQQRRIRVAHGAARVEAARLKDRSEGTKIRIRRKSIYQKLRTDLTYMLLSGNLT